MKEIIVPVDGSQMSEQAFALATALARATSGRLNLVHVIEPPPAARLRPLWSDAERARAERYLAELRGRVGDVEVTTSLRSGHAAAEILHLADELPAALIVMATHGRGGLGRLMLGSVADKVVRGARVPVGLVRPSDGEALPVVALRRLLVSLDGSECGERALPLAIQLAKSSGGSVHLVQVIEPLWTKMYTPGMFEGAYLDDEMITETETALRADAREYLEGVTQRFQAEGVAATLEVRYGRPAHEILAESAAVNADAIVMATHGRGGIVRSALGSVTQEVLYTCPKPLLVVPPGLPVA